jgi:uroporphyrinogen-III synthase
MSRATPALPLAEWYVISLRPLGMHAGVRRAAGQQGAHTFALSTLAIEPAPANDALLRALACAIVIVTSPVAARLALAGRDYKPRRGQQWFAVSPASLFPTAAQMPTPCWPCQRWRGSTDRTSA